MGRVSKIEEIMRTMKQFCLFVLATGDVIGLANDLANGALESISGNLADNFSQVNDLTGAVGDALGGISLDNIIGDAVNNAINEQVAELGDTVAGVVNPLSDVIGGESLESAEQINTINYALANEDNMSAGEMPLSTFLATI